MQREVYPALLLFPAARKKAILYEGDLAVRDIIKFVAEQGSNSQHLINQNGNVQLRLLLPLITILTTRVLFFSCIIMVFISASTGLLVYRILYLYDLLVPFKSTIFVKPSTDVLDIED